MLCCCGIVLWRNVYWSRSSSGREELRVQEAACFADCMIRIVVTHGSQSQQLAVKRDCSINFADAVWSGPRVAVFVDAGYCGTLKVAYDTSSGRPVNFDLMQQLLRAAIVKDYGVTPDELRVDGGDVFSWATYRYDGNARRSLAAFRMRYRR